MRSWKAMAKLYSPASIALAVREFAPSAPTMMSNSASDGVPFFSPGLYSLYLMV